MKRRQEELEKRAQELERREAELRNNPQNGKFIKDKSTLIVNFPNRISSLKFIYSEKATKFCETFPLLLTVSTAVKNKGKISQNFVAFSEYMNLKNQSSFEWLAYLTAEFRVLD